MDPRGIVADHSRPSPSPANLDLEAGKDSLATVREAWTDHRKKSTLP